MPEPKIIIRERHIGDYKQDPKNARKHNPRNLGTIEDSLHQHGAARSLVSDETDTILAGNGTIEAAASAGIERVIEIETDGRALIIHKRTGLSNEQKIGLALADNRSAELAEWDPEQLRRLQEAGDESLKTLFTDKELVTFFASTGLKSVEHSEAASPDVEHVPTSIVSGDLFALGRHRLICGDSTRPEVLSILMAGMKADLVVTDPPFFAPATHYQSRKGWQRSYADVSPLREFWRTAFLAMVPHVVSLAHWFVFCNSDSYPPFYEVMFDRFEKIKAMVWDKGHVGLGRIWRNQQELILWARVPDHYAPPDGQLRSDVLRYDATPSADREHPVQKPVALTAELMIGGSPAGAAVLDPFAGSGSTLIAAEKCDRVCYAADIDPRYCQIVINAWEAETGSTAVRLNE